MAKKEETFLLVSLKESESKKLAQIIANNTSRKILNFLTTAEKATESEISKKLSIPISTVHYNLKHLMKAKLIDSKEYHYSEKGKEVNHYSLSKKYIIIAPTTSGIKTKLRSIFPMVIVIAAGAAIIHFITSIFAGASFGAVQKTAELTAEAEPVSLALIADEAAAPISTGISHSAGLPIAVWFLIGGIVVILVYLIISLIKKK